jgi:hypothetical protein
MSAETLYRTYEKSDPVERVEAMQSYERYRKICGAIAERHGFSLEIACGVFSALSPNNEYHGNIRDLETVLVNERAGNGPDSYRVATYGNNKRKASEIARGTPVAECIRALKTWNFFNNVYDPSDPNYVTVDGHMYWCWRGHAGTVKGLRGQSRTTTGLRGTPTLGRALYGEIAGDIKGLALALGIVPCQLQAILWVTWKRLHKRAYDFQTTFFPKDFEVAGLIDLGRRPKTQPVPRPPKQKDNHPQLKFTKQIKGPKWKKK